MSRLTFTLTAALTLVLMLAPATADAKRTLGQPRSPELEHVFEVLGEAHDALFDGIELDLTEADSDVFWCLPRRFSWLCVVDMKSEDGGWYRIPVSISRKRNRWTPLLTSATFSSEHRGKPCSSEADALPRGLCATTK